MRVRSQTPGPAKSRSCTRIILTILCNGACRLIDNREGGKHKGPPNYAFDLWTHRWRRTKATGDVIVIRYAEFCFPLSASSMSMRRRLSCATCKKECARSNWRCTRLCEN